MIYFSLLQNAMFYSILSVSIDVSIDVSIECPSSVHRVSTTRQVIAKDSAAHTFTMILFLQIALAESASPSDESKRSCSKLTQA